jgi:hypothetical protein
MSSFRFPPPPPPPPKASASDNQPTYPSQRGGYDRGRGNGGRGRGSQGRGGGGDFSGNSRGGRGGSQSRGGPRGGYQENRGGSSQRGGSGSVQGQWQQSNAPLHANTPYPENTSNGAYANPLLYANPPPVDPNTFVQAMSFMATPAGAQSMATLAGHMNVGGSPLFAQPQPQPQYTPQPPRYSPAQQSGQKRKWDDHKGNTQQKGTKPPRAKAAVAPAIPTFGFTLPTPLSAPAPSKPNRKHDKKRSKVKLGLTNEAIPDESSDEEEVLEDEEAALAAKIKGGGYAFEHDGEHISLQTAGDIAEWIKDRRRNFPTYEKAMQKAQAAEAKRKHELEFVRKLRGKPSQAENQPARPERLPANREPRPPKELTPQMIERNKRDEKKQEELAALRKKLHESMMKKREAPTTVDLGVGYGSATESEAESSVLSDSSVVSSSEESSDSEADESDAPPEATSSKIAPPPVKVPPPAPAQIERKPDNEKTCMSWRQYGKCKFGHSCRFQHPPKDSRDSKGEKRTGLYEKLVEQEMVKADQTMLDAIKYLGQNGFLG